MDHYAHVRHAVTRRSSTRDDTSEQILTVFSALHDATPALREPLRVPDDRRLEKRLTSYDQSLRQSSYDAALSFGIDPETAADIADEFMSGMRRIWSATLDTLAAVPS